MAPAFGSDLHISILRSGGARPQNLGGHLRGKLIYWGGGQDRIFKKVLLFAHAVVTGLSPPPQEICPPLIAPL
jgi:hypothetical protein